MGSFDPLGSLFNLIFLVLFVATVWGIIDAASRPTQAYVAAGKLTKPAWLGILVAALVLPALTGGGLGLFGIAAIIAVIVYFVDVRPALREVGRGPQGPYGPWR